MEDFPVHYNPTTLDFVFVPIEQIVLDTAMRSAIRAEDGGREALRMIRPMVDSQGGFVAPLNRMHEKAVGEYATIPGMLNHFEGGTALPPVVLQRVGNRALYRVVDGRHRVAASYLYRYAVVPAVIR